MFGADFLAKGGTDKTMVGRAPPYPSVVATMSMLLYCSRPADRETFEALRAGLTSTSSV